MWLHRIHTTFGLQVEPDCPDFATYYGGIEHAVKIKVLSMSTLFDQASMMYLNAFIQSILSRFNYILI